MFCTIFTIIWNSRAFIRRKLIGEKRVNLKNSCRTQLLMFWYYFLSFGNTLLSGITLKGYWKGISFHFHFFQGWIWRENCAKIEPQGRQHYVWFSPGEDQNTNCQWRAGPNFQPFRHSLRLIMKFILFWVVYQIQESRYYIFSVFPWLY